jgi:hypothetical protein
MLLNQINPSKRGITGSNSSEGSNKYLSFKRFIPNLRMVILISWNNPKSMMTGHIHKGSKQRKTKVE